MADRSELESLDPYDLLDREASRIAAWVEQLDEGGLAEASACEGWSRRDVLSHLLATEEYHHACLSGRVAELMERLMGTGASSLDEINAMGVAAHSGRPVDEVLTEWKEQNAETRAGLRAADGTDIDSTIGSYPARDQAFHVAYELAIHADDMGVPVVPEEAADRLQWMAGVSRFTLTDVKDDVSVERSGAGYTVRQGDVEATFDRETFVAGVSGRVEAGALTEPDRELLSLGY